MSEAEQNLIPPDKVVLQFINVKPEVLHPAKHTLSLSWYFANDAVPQRRHIQHPF